MHTGKVLALAKRAEAQRAGHKCFSVVHTLDVLAQRLEDRTVAATPLGVQREFRNFTRSHPESHGHLYNRLKHRI